MYVVKKQHKGTVVSRMIVGFGQHEFKIGEMTSEEVEKWKKREGGDVTEFFDVVKDGEAHKLKEAAEEAAAKVYRDKVTALKALGFKRVADDFVNGDKTVSAQTLLDSTEEGFQEILKGLEEPKVEDKTTEAEAKAAEEAAAKEEAAKLAPAATATKSTGTKSTGTKSTGTKSVGTKK